jgi:unsaturated chondroitin disaccharide hydrolase
MTRGAWIRRLGPAVMALGTVVAGPLGCGKRAVLQHAVAPAPPTHSPTLLRRENLEEAKYRVRSGDPALRPAYEALLRDAELALHAGPFSVMQKHTVPPSGDKHDYQSSAPYWWPDSTKPDGLPYVRRDGVRNPQSRVDHDGVRFGQMSGAVEALVLAHYFTGESRYAERAGLLLRTWFLDTATRMNPHLEYAQGIPGLTQGRGFGMIDLSSVPRLLDAVRLLEGAPGWTRRDAEGLTGWWHQYLAWVRDSENGRDERTAANNHGTWYAAQVGAIALFVGDSAFARELLGAEARRRLASQIASDGRQPLELARTRALSYSLFNLEAFAQVAELGRHVGEELWHEVTREGASLRAALRFVAPYSDTAMPFRGSQITPVTADNWIPVMRPALAVLGDAEIARVLARLPDSVVRTHRSALLYPKSSTAKPTDSVADVALRHAAERLRRSATSLNPGDGFPRRTRDDGSWEQRPARDWTSGFFAGSLWYMYQHTGAAEWRVLADRWTVRLEEVKTLSTTHDLGFLLFDSFGNGFLLTREPRYRDVVLEGSRTLARRFNDRVGAIKSWDTENRNDHRRLWKYPVIVDNLMNLEMLFWAARNGGDTAWARMAERHALTSARAHVRPDGSTAHVALFDPATGQLEGTVTWQGHADTSTWARGQAWAIHGLTTAYRYTRRPELLEAAGRAADWFVAHLPPDAVPFWDFSDPGIPAVERDASAGAIAASGLIDLARHVDGERATRYRAAAERILGALSSTYLTTGTSSAAILQHAVGQRPQGAEIDVGLVYADYYFVEALLRRRGVFLE